MLLSLRAACLVVVFLQNLVLRSKSNLSLSFSLIHDGSDGILPELPTVLIAEDEILVNGSAISCHELIDGLEKLFLEI